jgi:hypothetical protein
MNLTIDKEGKEKIAFLYETPIAELSSKDMIEQLNDFFGVRIPYEAWAKYFNAKEKPLSGRPKKVRPVEKPKVVRVPRESIFSFEEDDVKTEIDVKTGEVTLTQLEGEYEEPIGNFEVPETETEEVSSNEENDWFVNTNTNN